MAGIFQTLLGSLAGAAKDTFFRYVSLLLPGNGTNGAQNNTFLDGSTNNFTITRNGNTTQGTFTPFGSNWSNYFDGNGDYLTIPDSTAFTLGSGDWTVEAWFYIGSISAQCIGGQGNSAGLDRSFLLYASNASGFPLVSVYAPTAYNITSSTAITAGTWNHLAAVRNGNTLTLYLNGASVGSTSMTGATVTDMATPMTIGRAGDFAGEHLNGYVSNFRLVKGTAVYTANFTPPTAPLTAITNTQLLTCQSNRFRDNSTNNFTITRNGDVSVQRFSPFSPSAAYSASVIGGSGYFDGNGDYLAIPANAAFNFGAGAFTLECWAYRTGAGSGDRFLIDQQNGIQYTLRYNASGVLQLILLSGVALSYTFTMAIGEWYHIVAVRSGSSIALFVNGVRQATGTSSSSIGSNTEALAVGAKQGGGADFFEGYISNARIVKGTAVYDPSLTTLTVPTAPLTAITNTSLLLNFTNAGIIDNAMMNDLETVGNAQISTAQSKFGGSSMYFDGTGDYLTSNAPSGLALYSIGANEQFTVEMWVYRVGNGTGGSATLDAIIGSNSGAFSIWGVYVNRSTRVISFNNSAGLSSTSGSITDNTWTHIAVTRDSSNTLRIFIDGVSGFSGSNTGTGTLVNPLYIGRDGTGAAGNSNFNGYIDDLRITKGVARYTANFTPPGALPTS